ncbi:hypothetical protein JW933_06495 [candidate division FCPU426 bacterium]|nr:hypothetical protein [candidate division FCPU426 bacterium]
MSVTMTVKQQQFNAAMEKYDKKPEYQLVGRVVSFAVIVLQVLLAVLTISQSIGPAQQVLVFAAAYIAADFINGLVHMFMDNNDDYESPAGPLVASFHLHHRTPRYKKNNVLFVYYHESGAKIWLAFFLVFAVLGVWQGVLSGVAAYGVLYFSVLSSIAEVSHYLCHVPLSGMTRFLGQIGLLMSKRHHRPHHTEDNVNYAFLNGMTDPLLNVIAKHVYPGYKKTTDIHYAQYAGADTENRA